MRFLTFFILGVNVLYIYAIGYVPEWHKRNLVTLLGPGCPSYNQ